MVETGKAEVSNTFSLLAWKETFWCNCLPCWQAGLLLYGGFDNSLTALSDCWRIDLASQPPTWIRCGQQGPCTCDHLCLSGVLTWKRDLVCGMLLLVLSPVRWISLRIIVLVHRLLPGDGGGWPHKQYSCASLCWKGACRKGFSIYCPDLKHFHTFCVPILYFPFPGSAPNCCPSHLA